MLLLLAFGCSSFSFEGVEGLSTIGSVVTLDLFAQQGLLVGEGDIGPVGATTLVLTDEEGWCDAERERLDAMAPINTLAVASLPDDPTLCAAGAGLIEDLLALETHDPDRRVLAFDLCAGSCTWEEVPVDEPLAVPSGEDPFAVGQYRIPRAGIDPAGDYWDRDACATTDALAIAIVESADTWRFDGTLTFDGIRPNGAAHGSFDGKLKPDGDQEPGSVEGGFEAAPCVLDVDTVVFF